MVGLKPLLPGRRSLLQQDRSQDLALVVCGDPPLVVVALDQFGVPEKRPESSLLPDIDRRDLQQAVRRFVETYGGHLVMISACLGFASRAAVIGQMGPKEHEGGVEHREIDMLPPARALALEQSRRERKSTHDAGGIV